MLHRLRRHRIPTRAHFEFTLALTFALPAEVLEPLLYPGLTLDTFQDFGFACIALVQTRGMRPAFLPEWLGGSFMLTGYRLFTRYQTPEGKTLRGLQVLRSDTDKRAMVALGNLFTHYRYAKADIDVERRGPELAIRTRVPNANLDVHVRTDVHELPKSSPFTSEKDARRFAGPMPYTFSFERETHSMVRIEGRRRHWKPTTVSAEVREATFFASRGLPQPRLASAFMVEDIPYEWKSGIVSPLA